MKAKTLFTIIIEKDEDGYIAYCPQLQGCYTQGDSYEEVILSIEDAIKLHTEDRKAENESWSTPMTINVTSLELSV